MANANPVVSDSSTGIFGDIYFAAKRYKVVIKDTDGNTLRTWDPVDATKQRLYQAAAPSPTYPGLEWVDTDDNVLYERNVADSGWNNRGDADSAINAASVTEVLAGTETAKAVTPDSGAAVWQRGTNLTPSGGTVSLPAGGGGVFNVAAGNFAAISSAVGGRSVLFVFGGTSVITHNATSMILPGGANITSEAGDCARFVNEAATDASGANWRCVWYARDGTTLAAVPNYAASQSEMETPSSALRWVTPAVMQYHPGVAKFWVKATANSTTIEVSHNMTSWADTATGRATGTIATDMSSVDWCIQATIEHDGSANLQGAALANGTQAAGTFEVSSRNQGGGLDEPTTWHVTGHGDQA